jgi:hypothetical protein
LEAADCEDLLQGLGFVIALTFDPPSNPVGEPAQPEEPVAPQPPVEPSDRTPEPPSRQQDSTDFDVGIGPALFLGPAPNAMFGVEAHATLSWPGSGAIRVGLSWSASEVERDGGRAEFSLVGSNIWACWFALGNERWAIRPCASMAFGSLRVAGTETDDAETHTLPWLSAGVGVLVDVGLSDSWKISASAALRAPFKRHKFQFDPVVFHEFPPLAPSASIAASVVF